MLPISFNSSYALDNKMGSGSPAYPQLSFDDNPDTFVSSRKASQKSTFAQRTQSAALWVVGLLGLGTAGFLLHKSSLFTKMTERFAKKGSVNPATPGVRSSATQSGTKTSLQKFIKSNYPTYRVPGPAKTWVDDYMKAKGITGNPPVIGFYESNELGYVFSNTYNKKLTFNGETFNTPEHALQMAKFAPLKKTNPTAYQQIKDHLSSLSGGSLQKAVKGYKYDPRAKSSASKRIPYGSLLYSIRMGSKKREYIKSTFTGPVPATSRIS